MRSIKFTFVILSSILVLAVQAQSKKEEKLNATLEQFRLTLIDPNEAILNNLTSTKLSYGHSGGAVEDQKTFVANMVNGKSDFVTINIADQTVDIDGNTAYVRHTFNAVTSTDPKIAPIKLKILYVWVYEGGSWKLRARQAVKILI
ncbi:MAG: nuclear transport factor 2 family protein [Sediminibacterium sp.]|jgi:hypothetical protein